MAFSPRLKAFAERALPKFLVAWLDPVQALIDSEVRCAADQLGKEQVVLDAGAGEARHKAYFARSQYIALDSCSGDLAWNYSGLDVRGNLQDLPLRSSSVDCVLCMVVLEHTRNPHQVILELARVLKPNGKLYMVVPFLWEEHQQPHDYFRFTRHGVRLLFEGSSFRLDLLSPIGGFFWVCARRSVNLLSFFQSGWRWILFALLAPLFGFLMPLVLYFADGLDKAKNYSLGFRIRATRIK